MKYLLFKYVYPPHLSVNLGDYVQTIAVREALKQIGVKSDDFIFYDRDALSYYSGEECVCVMNGWFYHSLTWFLSKNISPIYFGTHITDIVRLNISGDMETQNMFNGYTVGARDYSTKEYFLSIGIDAFYSGCLTLTLPWTSSSHKKHKIIFVDVNDRMYDQIPNSLKKASIRVSQKNTGPATGGYFQQEKYYSKAEELLEYYKNEAVLIVTSALHCACPCLAMGIPVVFLWSHSHNMEESLRISLVSDFLPVYTPDDVKYNRVEWAPPVPDLTPVKQKMLGKLKSMISERLDNSSVINGNSKPNSNDLVRHRAVSVYSDKPNYTMLEKIFSVKRVGGKKVVKLFWFEYRYDKKKR